MSTLEPARPLRGAIVGLGMMGRHHARLLQTSPRIAFAGAVDPLGDRHAAVRDPALVYRLHRRAAGPREPGLRDRRGADRRAPRVAEKLAAAGVHMLIEKPLAGSVQEGEQIIAVVAERPACAPPSATSSASTPR